MKKVLCTMMLLACIANAGIIGGPRGGKLLEKGEIRAEFFVNSEKYAEVYFYDADLNLVAPEEQSVKALVNANGKVVIGFDKTDSGFVSTDPLPEGDGYRVVLQIRDEASGEKANFRIDYLTTVCGGCSRIEYACICDHAAE